MKKKIGATALCLTFLLVLSLSAFAAPAGDAVAGRITGRAVAHGNRAAVTVALAEGTGAVCGRISVTYDVDTYTLVRAEAGEAAAGDGETADGICELNTEEDGLVSVSWVKETPDTAGGVLLSVLLEEIPAEEDEADEDADVETDGEDETVTDGSDESEDAAGAAPITVTVHRLSDTYDGNFAAEDDDCFELIPADRGGLDFLRCVAGGLSAEDYTAESRAGLTAALDAAEELPADATREEIDVARLALAEALFALEAEDGSAGETADRRVLSALYVGALELDEADFNLASWADLLEALENAEAVLADGDATRDEVNAAAAALLEAVMDLEEAVFGEPEDPEEMTESEESAEADEAEEPEGADASGDVRADRSELEQTYETATGFDPADYTEESWSDLSAALARADAVLNKETATQGEDDGALAALLAAIVGLESTEDAEILTQTGDVDTADDSRTTLASVLVALGLLAICGMGYFLSRKHR